MVDSKTTPKLEKNAARMAYRFERSQRRAGTKELVKPTVPGIVDTADGTLNKDVSLGTSLEVSLPEWAELVDYDGESDTYTLEWAVGDAPGDDTYIQVFTGTVTAPVADGTFPMKVQVPMTALSPGVERPADGIYHLRYRIKQPNEQETASLPVPLIVDTTPPGKHLEPAQMTLNAAELTQQFIEENPGGLIGTLPDYEDWKPGDKVAFYWIGTPLPDPEDLPDPIGYVDVASAVNNSVTFPLSTFADAKDEPYYVAYILVDKATNRSPLSNYRRIDVALGPLPANLLDPVVPLAEAPEHLINLDDARMGVEVLIESFDNWKPTDRIEVTWGTAVLRPEEMGSFPTFPVSIRVPDKDLRDQYVYTTGGDQTTSVSYRVLRGVLSSDVKSTTVNVNFSYIGPVRPDPDPEWPDPVNDALLPVEVYGQTSNTMNTLTPADKGQPAIVNFTLYGPLVAGEIIDFYWAASLVPEARYTVLDGDTANTDRQVEIPWRYIESEGNRVDLPVHYRIHAADSENAQHSPATLVSVSAIVIIPDAPTFDGLSPGGWLNCNSLFKDPANPAPGEPGVRVSIPDLSKYLVAGDTVTLHWIASTDEGGEDVIPGTEKIEAITLDDTRPAEGFTWLVTPYDIHILPTYDPAGHGRSGFGRIKYSFILQGETITSLQTTARVGMYDASGSCPIG